MNTELEQQGTNFTRRAAAALMCAVAVIVLAGGLAMRDDGGLVPDAIAAASTGADARDGYFPAQFPMPQGAPEPHIEAF